MGEIIEYENWNPDISNYNLVENGDQEYENNYNWTTFVWDGTNNALSITSGSNTVYQSNYIELKGNSQDSWDQYKLDGIIKGVNETSNYYFMIICYDIDKRRILTENVSVVANTATTLASELVSGDSYAHVTDLTNWFDDGTSNYNHIKNLALWKDGDAFKYTPLKYTSRLQKIGDVDKTLNRLHFVDLSSVPITYSGDTIPAGSVIQNHQSGGTYSYIGASNVVNSLTEWQFQTGNTSTTPSVGNIRYGTKYIKVGFLINREATAPTTLIKNIRFYNLDHDQKMESIYWKPSIGSSIKSAYFSEVGVTDGMIGYWPLDGTTEDISETRSVMSSTDVTFGSGVKNSAGVFNGTSSQFNLSNSDAYRNNAFNISVWFKSPGLGVGQGAGGMVTITYGVRLILDVNGKVSFFTYNGGAQSITSPLTYFDDTWHSATATYGNGVKALYVDGELISSISAYNDWNWTNSVMIGRDVNASTFSFLGSLDEVRIYNRALSNEEVAINYEMIKYKKLKMTNSTIYSRGIMEE